MKALKEKRIGLRSLWRRGLVILSLFALVFASCNDSSGSTEETGSGQKVTKAGSLAVKKRANGSDTAPAAKQYEATKFDFGDLTIVGEYEDGTTFEFSYATHPTRFKVVPEMVQGAVITDYQGTYIWAPLTEYTVTVAAGTEPWIQTYRVGGGIQVIPIQRGQVSVDNVTGNSSYTAIPIYALTGVDYAGSGSNTAGVGTNSIYEYVIGYRLPSFEGYVMNSALNLVGPTMDNNVYIDYMPDKSQYRIQATYVDLQKKEIPNQYAEFEVRPYYNTDNQRDRENPGPGDLLVTVGRQNNVGNGAALKSFMNNASIKDWVGLGLASLNGVEGGFLTAMHPFDKVYHVKSISVTSPIDPETNANDLPFMYYFEQDTSAAWKDRLGDMEITISYADEGKGFTRTEKIKNLGKKEAGKDGDGLVWWNTNPYNPASASDPYASAYVDDAGNSATQFAALDYKSIGILGVHMSNTPANKLTSNPTGLAFNKIAEPNVKINYRGAITEVPVDVGIKFDSIRAEYKDGSDEITVTVKALDNDVAGNDAMWYSGKVNVIATINTARGSQRDVNLRYSPVGGSLDNTNAKVEPFAKDGGSVAAAKTGITALAGGAAGIPRVNPANGVNRLVYTMDYGNSGTWQESFTDGWGQSNIAKNDNVNKVVTFYFNTPTVGATTINNTTTSKTLKASADVHWTDVRSR